MEGFEHIFVKANPKTQTIGLFKETYILIYSPKLENQELTICSGSYIEREERKVKAKDNFELIIPKKSEHVISIRKKIQDEFSKLHCFIFSGRLNELFLAELYYKFDSYPRFHFKYTDRQLGYGEHNSTRILISLTKGGYEVEVCIALPISHKLEKMLVPIQTNEFKLIEKLFMKVKLNPSYKTGATSSELQKLLFKYYPSKPY